MIKVLVHYQIHMTIEMEAHKSIRDFGSDGVVDATCENANDEIFDALKTLPDGIYYDITGISIEDKNTGEIYYDG